MSDLFNTPDGNFLFDTLLWTGALIALVLILRRPAARLFGPQIAYALWALPLLRLVLPPIELPASFAPQTLPAPEMVGAMHAVQFAEAQALPETTQPLIDAGLIMHGLIAVWLMGAAIFLIRRFSSYFQMRRDLLADAREVGRDGSIHIIETPATNAPLAFGLRRKFVALPMGFMADYDRERRDLALAHELAHHRGNDLLINFLAQPLFALHWFNPLAYLGWLALRRDQEAACDARVIARQGAERRGTYARIIASFAAGPNVALAAPMACPVLGEKSIIHRLRSLNMTHISSRRRWAGRAMMAGALVALPLTASISYAENAAPTPPAPPAAPSAPAQAPLPPAAPAAPLPSEAPVVSNDDVEEIDGEDGAKIFIIRNEEVSEDGNRVVRVKKVHKVTHGDVPSDVEMAAIMAEVKRELAEADRQIAEAKEEHRIALAIAKDGARHPAMVEVECDGKDGPSDWTSKDGKRVIKLCKTHVLASALAGLREARAELASDPELPDDVRAEVLRELDAQIKQWEKKK